MCVSGWLARSARIWVIFVRLSHHSSRLLAIVCYCSDDSRCPFPTLFAHRCLCSASFSPLATSGFPCGFSSFYAGRCVRRPIRPRRITRPKHLWYCLFPMPSAAARCFHNMTSRCCLSGHRQKPECRSPVGVASSQPSAHIQRPQAWPASDRCVVVSYSDARSRNGPSGTYSHVAQGAC